MNSLLIIRKSLALSMTILLGLALPIFADPPGYSLGAVFESQEMLAPAGGPLPCL
jgi:hypothetical protein